MPKVWFPLKRDPVFFNVGRAACKSFDSSKNSADVGLPQHVEINRFLAFSGNM